MTSFVIVASNAKKLQDYIDQFCKDHAIDPFDQTILTLETPVKQNTQSIGIEDILQMQKKLFLKPIKSETKAVIIRDAHVLTHEAQNALLKVLEEPPAHTLVLLATDSKESLLPTILSRCQVIQLEEEQIKLSEKKLAELTEFIDTLPTLTVGEKLKKAETLAKDKDKAIAWIEKVIIVLHNTMLEDPENKTYPRLIKAFQALHTLLKTTNVNSRFAIETTLLSIAV